jgi:archaellum component FlaF (FlaF/FlaG flagellin family)
MKSIVKKVSAALLIVPMLVLGISLFGAMPAQAADIKECREGGTLKNCYTVNGSTRTYYDASGKVDRTCNIQGGLAGALDEKCSRGEGQQSELFGPDGIVTLIINIMLFLVGILCVIMIIFGGIRYVTSTGDKGRVDGAKNTIVYAVVGLVIAIVAYALVNWGFTALQ